MEQEGYVPWTGVVEHLFFHPVIAYPELAFDGGSSTNLSRMGMASRSRLTTSLPSGSRP